MARAKHMPRRRGQISFSTINRAAFSVLPSLLNRWLPGGQACGVDLYLDRQGVDTTTPAGRALFQMLGVFGELERAIIQARVKGTKSGKPFGRPKIPTAKEATIRRYLSAGYGIRKTAKLAGVGNETVARIKRAMTAAGA